MQIGGAAVGVDDDMIGGAALRGEGGFDIGVTDMLVAGSVEAQRLGSALRGLDRGGVRLLVDRDHLAACAVDPARLAVVAREPDAVSGLEFQWLGLERLRLARAPLPQAPVDVTAVLGLSVIAALAGSMLSTR